MHARLALSPSLLRADYCAMAVIPGARPWLSEYLLEQLSSPSKPPDMSGCYAQVLDVNAATRLLTIFDGETTVEAILTESAAEELNKNDNGIGVGKLHGRTLALMATVLLPILNVVPPSVTLILQKVRVFSDRLAQRPIRTPPPVVSTPDVSRALRSAHLNFLMVKVPELPIHEDPVACLPTSGQSSFPPPSVCAQPISVPLPNAASPLSSTPRFRLSGSFCAVTNSNSKRVNEKGHLSVKQISKSTDVAENSIENNRNKNIHEPKLPSKPNVDRRLYASPRPDEGSSTEEIDPDEHKHSLPEIQQSLVKQGSLRDQTPPLFAMEEESAENDEVSNTVKNVQENKDDQTQPIVSEEAHVLAPDSLEVVDLPLTQFYDDDDDNESDKSEDAADDGGNVEGKVDDKSTDPTGRLEKHLEKPPGDGPEDVIEKLNGPKETRIESENEMETEEEPLSTLSPDPNVNCTEIAGVNTASQEVDKIVVDELKKQAVEDTITDEPAIENNAQEEEKEIESQDEICMAETNPATMRSIEENARRQVPKTTEIEMQMQEADNLLMNNQTLVKEVAEIVDNSMDILCKLFREPNRDDYWSTETATAPT